MEKYIKSFTLLVFSSILAFSFSSCSDDDDKSLDKFWVDIATIHEVGENTYDFTLDDGTKLWVAAPIGLNLKPKYNRAIIDYTILSDKKDGYDHYIKLNGFSDILTKKPVYIAADDQHKQDSIGDNYIKVHAMWEGGGFLNIRFGYNAGGEDAHMLNLVSDKQDLGINDATVKLEFRHNQKGDPEYYPIRGYVSFDLSPYKIAGKEKVTFEIAWTDFGNENKTKTIEYRLDGVGTQQETVITTNEYPNLNIY